MGFSPVLLDLVFGSLFLFFSLLFVASVSVTISLVVVADGFYGSS
jgi:hypothetical protein